MRTPGWRTLDWVIEAQRLGAGEIVLNCMDSDGVRCGYDIEQLRAVRVVCNVPLIASGGAGEIQHFAQVFEQADVDGARSEEHTSELKSLMRISYAVFCLKKKT